ncbi:MAG: hypothetical protein QNJ65_24350 [Xenococcaceae cyanobacterium MO_234.B1]|nr:hypothetical protein [Xenococcaceae cyanobacterium MO_234.B1]
MVTVEKSKSREIIALKPAQYTYPVFIIQLAIQQRIISFSSWRAIEKNFKLWAQFFNLPTPDFTTIRQWFLKLGIFELIKSKEKRTDWIFIIDTIVEQGHKKCLLILGLSYQQWTEKLKAKKKTLQHHDLDILAIEIVEKTQGEIIESLIDNLANTVGKPLQIISDHGSDIKKGIELYISRNPGIIYTYDFTHQVALWLKKDLSKNHEFLEFLQQCNVTLSQIKQTKLSFLRPTSQRSKARYHNLDILVNWGLNLVQYWKKQDFSLITTEFIIDRETLFLLREELDQTSLRKLAEILGTKASSKTSFYQVITEKFGRELCQKKVLIISQAAELGRRKFLEKLGWLLDYEKQLQIYAEILEVFAKAKKQLTQQGLHPLSQPDWLELTKEFSDSPWVQKTQQKVAQYLGIEGQKIPQNQAFLATSDIIESIFGKYKIFASSASNSEINEMILTLVLSTTKLTPDKVLQAMETIQVNDVNAWSEEVFGQSMLSKRKLAFSTSTNSIKVA